MNCQFKRTPPVKMSRKQAKILWENMTPQQKKEFMKMYEKLCKGELKLQEINSTDTNQVKNIVLVEKEKPSVSPEIFYSHFPKKED